MRLFHLLAIPYETSKNFFSSLILLFLLVLLFTGCSNTSDDSFPVFKVTGVVTYEGLPLEGASVTFIPDNSNTHKMSASNITDANGKYILNTQGIKKSGAVTGKYNVTISKIVVAEQHNKLEDAIKASKSDTGKGGARQELPAKYLKPESSGFTVVVEPNDNNVFNFDLKK
jgi:hypothetical protein